MGTRADFYIRKEKTMEWLGSIDWDGHPESIDEPLLKATTEHEYRQEVTRFFNNDRDDVTLPENGWPWPWEDSRTTDFAYIFENGKVMGSNFGYPLFDPINLPTEEDDSDEELGKMDDYFPNMKHIQNVNFGKGSGLVIVQSKQKNEHS